MPPTPYELVIFDCDGVLVDSEVIVIEFESEMLTRAGFEMTVDDCANHCVGLSWPDVIGMLEERFKRPVPDGLSEEIQKASLAAYPDRLKPVEGMAAYLEMLIGPRCVASSSDLDRIHLSLELTNLSTHFEPATIFSAQMVENGKPAPDLFLYAASHCNDAKPQDCVVIEDSPAGVSAALAAGMDVIGFTGGQHARPSLHQRLSDSGATVIVDHPSKFVELINTTQASR